MDTRVKSTPVNGSHLKMTHVAHGDAYNNPTAQNSPAAKAASDFLWSLSGITVGHGLLLFLSFTAPLLPVLLWDLILLLQGMVNSPGWVAPLW